MWARLASQVQGPACCPCVGGGSDHLLCPVTLQSKEAQAQVVSNLKSISMSSSKLLLAAKALSADPAAPNLKNQLASAAR